jgi:hypothetical protein
VSKKEKATADGITDHKRHDNCQQMAVVGAQRQLKSKASSAVGTNLSDIDSSSFGEGGGLLWGTYDEEASAKSFQDAVQAWRDSGKKPAVQMVTSTCEVQAGVAEVVSKTQLEGYDVLLNDRSSGLNYMERMLLKKMRSNTPLTQLHMAAQNSTELDISEEKINDETIINNSLVVGGYVFDGNSDDGISVTDCHIENDLIVTEVSDSELFGLEDNVPTVEAIVDEASDDSEIVGEEAVCPPVVAMVDTVPADASDLKTKNKQENITEPSERKPIGQSSKNSQPTKIVTRQTKSRSKKRSQEQMSKRREPRASMPQAEIVNPVPVAWSQNRPYSGLGGFFLAAVKDHEAQDSGKKGTAENTAVNECDINFPLLTKAMTWNPLTSFVDGSNFDALVDITHIVDPSQFQSDSDSDDGDESVPVYMRPSSVLRYTDLNETGNEDNEEDTKALETLALELQSFSCSRAEQNENSPVISVSDSDRSNPSIDSPGKVSVVRQLDIDTLMDDFEEMENKIMQGHEC